MALAMAILLGQGTLFFMKFVGQNMENHSIGAKIIIFQIFFLLVLLAFGLKVHLKPKLSELDHYGHSYGHFTSANQPYKGFTAKTPEFTQNGHG